MSASTIARWNAIPMTREPDTSSSHKRSRSNDDDDSSDDDVSLVSRSSSPQPDTDIIMKDGDVYSYDEHVPGVAREVVTVETKIKSSNKGFALLAKMGWTEGRPLGLSGDGRVDPVPFTVKQDATGLGKVTQDFRMIETTVSQRRNLGSERMRFETAEQRQQREAAMAQKAAVQSEISTVIRPFYCELCDKQFQNVTQYDEHTNSYAHHHKARARDMNANHPMRAVGQEEAEKRKEKERKREEKELRRLAKAAGIKLIAPPVATPSVSVTPSAEGKGFMKPIGTASETPKASTSSADGPMPVSSTSGHAPHGPPPPPPSSSPYVPQPSSNFRSGGWSTLSTSSTRASSTGSVQPLPSDPPRLPPPPPPPMDPSLPSVLSGPPPAVLSSPSSYLNPTPSPEVSRGDSTVRPPSINAGFQTNNGPPLPPSNMQTQLRPSSNSNPDTSNRPRKAKGKSKNFHVDEEAVAQSRGNWQSFQKMRGRH